MVHLLINGLISVGESVVDVHLKILKIDVNQQSIEEFEIQLEKEKNERLKSKR